MGAAMFALAYLFSWLVMGPAVVLAFGVAADARRNAHQRAVAQGRRVAESGLTRIALVVLTVLMGAGVVYASTYAVYNLIIVP